jgi:AbiV family abortive infection protein
MTDARPRDAENNPKRPDKRAQDIEEIQRRCFVHAGRLLAGARSEHAGGRYNIAFHLALVALEEVGKGELQWLKRPPHPDPTKDVPASVDRRSEEHVKKLFWALWLVRYESSAELVRSLEESMDLARDLHSERLAGLYVSLDPTAPKPEDVVSWKRSQTIIDLAEARLRMAQGHKPRELTGEDLELLTWFIDANGDPETRKLIWGSASLAKLRELKSYPGWMSWLKEQFDNADREAREQVTKELARQRPAGAEASTEKWRIRIRLVSASHTVSAAVLKEWNKGITWIKLFKVQGSPRALDVDILGPKSVLAGGLWNYGSTTSHLIVAAFNVGTMGFWWWYQPEFTSRYYREIEDLETKRKLAVERSPALAVDWKGGPLDRQDGHRIQVVLGFLAALQPEKRPAVYRYMEGLSLLAKNDLFRQFEPNIFGLFYDAMKQGHRDFGGWDQGEDYRGVWTRQVGELFKGDPEQEAYFAAGEALLRQEEPVIPITLEQVAVMKILVDGFLTKQAQSWANERARLERDEGGSSEA